MKELKLDDYSIIKPYLDLANSGKTDIDGEK